MTLLYEFPLSHFCEKARWALDHHRVPFQARPLSPGLHVPALKRLGVPDTTVPVLRWSGQTLQGSAAIIDALDAAAPARALTPLDPGAAAEVARWETLADQAFGDDMRRVAYALLLEEPPAVIAMWTTHAPFWMPWVYRALWSQVVLGIRKKYRMRPERVVASREAFLQALDALDAQIDGRRYVVGDRLTRADIAIAALLSPLVQPAERPWRSPVAPPAAFATWQAELRSRPFWAWVEARYREDRGPHITPM